MKRAKKPSVAELDALAARRREQIARALAPREQLAFTPIGASSRNTDLPYAGAAWRDRPPGMTSKNQRERKLGLMSIISLRIDAATLARLDEEVLASIGETRMGRSKYDSRERAVTRSTLILDAVDAYLAEIAHRRAA